MPEDQETLQAHGLAAPRVPVHGPIKGVPDEKEVS